MTRPREAPRAARSAIPGEGGDRPLASCRSSSRRRPRRSSATRPSTPTGPTRACSPSAGSTSASRSRSTTGSIVPVIRDADTLSIHGLNVAIADVANRARAEQAPARRLRRRHVHRRQHRLARHQPRHADHQRARGRHRDDGGDHQAPGRGRDGATATSIAIRPVMNMVLGIDHRANDGAGGAALLRDIKAWLEARRPRHGDLLGRPPAAGARADARRRHRRGRLHRPGRRRAAAPPRRRRRRARPRPATAPAPRARRLEGGGSITLVRSSLADAAACATRCAAPTR